MRGISVTILRHQAEKLGEVHDDLQRAQGYQWETDEGQIALRNALVAVAQARASVEVAADLAQKSGWVQVEQEAPGPSV